jgi:hypothetical protein
VREAIMAPGAPWDGRHFGPRNLDFDGSWTCLGVETQNEIVVLNVHRRHGTTPSRLTPSAHHATPGPSQHHPDTRPQIGRPPIPATGFKPIKINYTISRSARTDAVDRGSAYAW